MSLRIATRGSALALWQAEYVREQLGGDVELVVIKTSGDRIQNVTLDQVEGQGFFTKEVEAALLDGRADIAVHSFKDFPTVEAPGLQIAAVPARGPVRDVLVHLPQTYAPDERWGLPQGAKVGTGSLRRKAQLLSCRKDLELKDLRGNVPTRVGKVQSGELDAVVLAEAGLLRLGYFDRAEADGIRLTPLPITDLCPAPAQGALALQARADDPVATAALAPLNDPDTAAGVRVERALLSRFGGGCHLPLGALCAVDGASLALQALVAAPDGSERLFAEARGDDPEKLAALVHADLVAQGAQAYVEPRSDP